MKTQIEPTEDGFIVRGSGDYFVRVVQGPIRFTLTCDDITGETEPEIFECATLAGAFRVVFKWLGL